MNMTAIQVQMPLQAKALSREKIPSELSSVFQGLLMDVKLPITPQANTTNSLKPKGPMDENNPSYLLKSLLGNLPEELKTKIGTLLSDTTNTKEVYQALESMELGTELLQQLKEMLKPITFDNANVTIQPKLDITTMARNINPTIVQVNQKEILQQLGELSKKSESLLSGITDPENIKKLAPEIQNLLEKWTSLERKLSGSNEGKILEVTQVSTNSTKAENVWRELLSNYQKRNQLMSSQQYNSNAKVTSSDVVKWIDNALSKNSVSDTALVNQVSPASMPASKVEQYVIYVNQSQNTQSSGQQLVDKFQEVVQDSKFLTMKNGSTQLSLSLRPANLGEMMVKLTQINGEMTVRIIVSSAAARDMLESNMHQLKHMFSPNQVVIEKQDIHTQQAQTMQQEKDQQTMNKDNQSQSEQSESDEQKQSSDEFEKQFHEILMNEKV